jgi:hypothetical protein
MPAEIETDRYRTEEDRHGDRNDPASRAIPAASTVNSSTGSTCPRWRSHSGRLARRAIDHSLGFTRMFRDYSFTLELAARGVDDTLVTIETFYEPRRLRIGSRTGQLRVALGCRRREGGLGPERVHGELEAVVSRRATSRA